MWVLCLNDMRSSNIENLQPVGRAETKQALLDMLARESVEGYRDGQWGKSYRKGGPLEWFNPPWAGDDHLHFQNAGGPEDWAQDARQRWYERVGTLPVLS